jgi:hypothetical protein
MRNSGPSDLFEFDFFISGRAGSTAAQEIAQVLRDADYQVYLPERDIFYGTKFVPGQFEAIARSRNLIIVLTKDFYESHFALADTLNFVSIATQDKRERRLVVIGLEESVSGRLIHAKAFGDVNQHVQGQKARIIAAVKGGLIISQESRVTLSQEPEITPRLEAEQQQQSAHPILLSDREQEEIETSLKQLGAITRSSREFD